MMESLLGQPLLHRTREHAFRFLRSLRDRRVAPTARREELSGALRVPLSEAGEDATSVIDSLAAGAEPGLLATAGPRFFGFVIGGSLPVSVAADWLAAVWDPKGGRA